MKGILSKGDTITVSALVVIWLSLVCTAGFGYVANIYYLITTHDTYSTVETVIAFAGLLIGPLGIVMGWVQHLM